MPVIVALGNDKDLVFIDVPEARTKDSEALRLGSIKILKNMWRPFCSW